MVVMIMMMICIVTYPTDDNKYECRTGPLEGFFVSSVEFCKHVKFDDKDDRKDNNSRDNNRTGTQGPPGPAGPQGPTGPQGPDRVLLVHRSTRPYWSTRP